jgi:UDPglucose--hexose-1-phosphate uridylyltransferase
MRFNPTDHPHRRYNPLIDEWVLVSPHRSKRPWQGQEERHENELRPPYDPQCYLCPGNTRAGGEKNPAYRGPYVFTNDFQALLPDTPPVSGDSASEPLLRAHAVRGTCRVICYSHRHDLSLAVMSPAEIRSVVDLWAQEIETLGKIYRWVQIFENRGSAMGCSNPHPHGQIWAGDFLPQEAAREDRCQAAYHAKHGETLLSAYLRREQKAGERVVAENAHWMVVVPYWAVWPFETLLLPKQALPRLPDLDGAARDSLSALLPPFLTAYNRLFNCSFPYSMGWHTAPGWHGALEDGAQTAHWHLHAHFYPPLLRSATVKKFMVGYELLAEAQRDLTAEQAAERLRQCLSSKGGV